MSDDLVKRARDCANGIGDMKTDRGDLGIFDDLADRIEELEAKLAKAVDALHVVTVKRRAARLDDAKFVARTTLAELTGGKDE